MGIGHLYWYALSFLLCGLYSKSHFEGWPEKGWGPHKGFRNRYRDDPEVKSKAAAAKAAADADKLAEEVAYIVAEYENKADKVDRKARHARARSRRRGESERERKRRKRRDREREESLERDLDHSLRKAERKIGRHQRRQREFEEEQQHARDETLERARERARRQERERGRERRAGEEEDETSIDSHPRKRLERLPDHDDSDPASPEQQAKTITDATQSTNNEPQKRSEPENEVKIILDSNGQPQVSLGPTSDNEAQDAFLPGGLSLPPRPPSAHAGDPKFNTPLPKSVREELLATKQTSAASTKSKKPFSLLMAFCRNQDILLTLVSYLPIPALISLYAISKTFHYLFNRHHTAFTMASVRTWAPCADTIYPWRCYKSLCTNDPLLRQKMKCRGLDPEEAAFRLGVRGRDLRDVPTLRWLQMVIWREGVCKDMLIMLATKGLRCPPGTFDAVKRMWFLMDLPLNSQRIALIQTSAYIGTHTIYGMTAFLLKVDMALTLPDQAAHPALHAGMPAAWAHNIPTGVPLRKMLLAERHLTPLWRVLRGWNWDPAYPRVPMTKLDALKLWVRHKFCIPDDAPEEVKEMSVMGIPWWEFGTAGLERTGVAFFNLDGKNVPVTHPAILSPAKTATHFGKQLLYPHRRVIHLPRVLEKPREPLLRPDELLIKEGVRRQMKMHTEWVHMMLWGFCDQVGFNWPVFTEKEWLKMDRREMNVVEVMQEKQKVLRAMATADVQE